MFAKLLIYSKVSFFSRGRVLFRPEQNTHMHVIRVKLLTSRGLALWGITAGRNQKPYLTFLQGAYARAAAAKGG